MWRVHWFAREGGGGLGYKTGYSDCDVSSFFQLFHTNCSIKRRQLPSESPRNYHLQSPYIRRYLMSETLKAK